jgi:hypothetical protein
MEHDDQERLVSNLFGILTWLNNLIFVCLYYFNEI